MKKKLVVKLILCIIILASVTVLASCGDTETDGPIIEPIEISLSIDYPEPQTGSSVGESGKETSTPKIDDVKDVSFKIEEGVTVFDAIQLYCSANDIPITVETTALSVEGINTIVNGSVEGQEKGSWKYKINGKFVAAPAGETVLEKGDSLEWVYTE